VKLLFFGTRGNTKTAAPRHRRHSSTLVTYRGRSLMIDCGQDWREEVWRIRPPAILLTHAHPDHADGLRDGAPCPVYAAVETWQEIAGYPIREREIIAARQPFVVEGIACEAFPVMHSLLAPAVGYRLTAGAVTIFYVPDVAAIPDQAAALRGAHHYVGDGAIVTRSLVRRRGDVLIGHAAIPTQLAWCRQEGVSRAIFTHCGSQLIHGETSGLGARLQLMGDEYGVRVEIAYDGMERVLR
jgi:phosphoribosyl 1,2-cyclic phosphodiesterase